MTVEAVNARVQIGEHANLKCEVRGYRKSDSLPQWSRHGRVLETDCTKYCQALWSGQQLVNDKQGRILISYDTGLLILNVSESDAGEYVCSVDGNSSSATLLIERNVMKKEGMPTSQKEDEDEETSGKQKTNLSFYCVPYYFRCIDSTACNSSIASTTNSGNHSSCYMSLPTPAEEKTSHHCWSQHSGGNCQRGVL